MICTVCGGLLVVEPAVLHCRSCGRDVRRPGVPKADLARQHALDVSFQDGSRAADILLTMLSETEVGATQDDR
jgi:hypothetical protein